ncbi:alanine racemase [bacterium]|nr:alanine racemase [bacterium]
MSESESRYLLDSSIETPCFVLDLADLDSGIQSLQEALSESWSNSVIGYSLKTNGLPWLLEYFRDQGFYAEVVSADEYELAKETGYDTSKIIYNGSFKSRETFAEALQNGCYVNVDSRQEIEWLADSEPSEGPQYQVGIRINFDLEASCPGQTVMGTEGSRFGFCYENGELGQAIREIESLSHVKLVGIHTHFSSKTRSLDIYRSIAQMCCQVKEEYNLDLSFVDIGGGFYGGLPNKPTYREYIEVIAEVLERSFDRTRTTLIVEPGTSLVSAPFSYFTRVIDVKPTTRNRFVITDGSRMDIDPLMRKTSYFHQVVSSSEQAAETACNQVVCGFTCLEDDRLFEMTDKAPLRVGDTVVYRNVGAYTMSLAPLFINYFPAVYLAEVRKYTTIRAKIRASDYYRMGR